MNGNNIYEISLVKKDGSVLPVEINAATINYKDKPAALVFVRDITQRKQAEEQIRKDLKEKEILLNEMHDRVKNNLQVICSLLTLQAKKTKDKAALDALDKSRNRIYSMSLVHNQLYESKNFARINCSKYMEKLVSGLKIAYNNNAKRIDLEIQVEDVFLDITNAIPVGLITNELISNAFNHAFPPSWKGKAVVTISLRQLENNEIELIVSDNGVGLSKNIEIKNAETLGLHLVTTLAEGQLGGEIRLERRRGTRFVVRFNV